MYLSVSDFIREAVRDKLRATKVIKVREIDYEQAKKEVLGYYKAYKEAFPYQLQKTWNLTMTLSGGSRDNCNKYDFNCFT